MITRVLTPELRFKVTIKRRTIKRGDKEIPFSEEISAHDVEEAEDKAWHMFDPDRLIENRKEEYQTIIKAV